MKITFNGPQQQALSQLEKDLKTTQAGVIKTALACLTTLTRAQNNGRQIAIVKDGRIEAYIEGF